MVRETGSLIGLTGVAVDSSGNVCVLDHGNSRIQFFTNDYVAPTLALDAFASPTSDSTPEIFGTATDTVSAIAGVEYQLDTITGAWTPCVAIDGGFDSMSEDFVCQVSPALTEASYTLYIRAVDAKSNQTADGDYTQITFTIGTDAQDIPATRPISTTTRKRASEPAKPAIAILPSGLNAGGVVWPNKQGGTISPNKVVLVLEPDSFPHAADLEVHSGSRPYIETQANPISVSSNTTPFFLPFRKYWQLGDDQEVWLKTFETDRSLIPTRIIDTVQTKPAIIALSYTPEQLYSAGTGCRFPESSLKLAHSLDGMRWQVLTSSVVDTTNHTVGAIHKVGGYYMIVMSMNSGLTSFH